MDLAHPTDIAHDALEVIRRKVRGGQIYVTPTVLDELATKAQYDPSPRKRADARKALASIATWKILTLELTDLQSTFARLTADKLLDRGVVLAEERNDALILAEAAVLDCQLLITSDSDLRAADPARLALVLRECQMPMVVIRTPGDIVREFAGR